MINDCDTYVTRTLVRKKNEIKKNEIKEHINNIKLVLRNIQSFQNIF